MHTGRIKLLDYPQLKQNRKGVLDISEGSQGKNNYSWYTIINGGGDKATDI